MTTLPPEDQPEDWRKPATQDELIADLQSLEKPARLAMNFCDSLLQREQYRTWLSTVVTPMSLSSWGDFSAAQRKLAAIPNMGYGSKVTPAVGDPTVVYFKIMSDVTSSYQVQSDTPVPVFVNSILTLVHYHQREWLVHHLGDYVRPEDIEH